MLEGEDVGGFSVGGATVVGEGVVVIIVGGELGGGMLAAMMNSCDVDGEMELGKMECSRDWVWLTTN